MWGLNDVLTYSIAYGMGEEEGRAKAEKEKKKESPWQIGTPTETGWYILCLYNKGNWYHPHFYVADFYSEVDGKMYWSNDEDWSEYTIVAWQKIEPYKED